MDLGSSILEKFEVNELIGSGGMGNIYAARHMLLDKKIVLKVLQTNIVTKKKLLRFQNEAKILSQLNHPNIAQVFDFGLSEKNIPFIAIEFIEGRTLEQTLAENGAFDLATVYDIVLQLCAALSHAHKAGIIHRDVKPGNIMLQDNGKPARAVLLDFGIAKLIANNDTDSDTDQQITSTGYVIGSPFYMSPEQTLNQKSITHRADQYSLGCVVFAMLTGRPPFMGQTPLETFTLHQNEAPPKLNALCDIVVPAALEQLVERLLAKDQYQRFSSMDEVARELKLLLKDNKSADPIEPHTVQQKKNSPSKLTLNVVAVIVLILFMVPFLNYTSESPKPKPVPLIDDMKLLRNYEMEKSKENIELEQTPGRWEVHLAKATRAQLTKFKGCDYLKVVDLSLSEATDDDMAYFSKSKLISLNLSETPIKSLSNVAKQTYLRELRLANSKVTGAELEKLKRLPMLQLLDLRNTSIPDDQLEVLQKVSSLRTVHLFPGRCSNKQVTRLREMMPWCAFPEFPDHIYDSVLDRIEDEAEDESDMAQVRSYKRCIQIAERAQGKDAPAVAHFLLRLATCYSKQGKTKEFLDCLNRAEKICLNRNEFLLQGYYDLRTQYLLSASPKKALEPLYHKLDLVEDLYIPGSQNKLDLLFFIASLEHDLGKQNEAIKHSSQALEILKTYGDYRNKFTTKFRFVLSTSLLKIGKKEEARKVLLDNLNYYRENNLTKSDVAACTFNYLGDAAESFNEQRQHYKAAIDTWEQCGNPNPTTYCNTCWKLYSQLLRAQMPKEAIIYMRKAFNIACSASPPFADRREFIYGNDLTNYLTTMKRQQEAEQVRLQLDQRKRLLQM